MQQAYTNEERIEEGFRNILTVADSKKINIVLVTNDRDFYTVKAELDISWFYGLLMEKATIQVEFILEPDNTIFITAIKPQVIVIDRIGLQRKTYEALYVPTGLAYVIAVQGLLSRYLSRV
jgi:hypothetical protein